MSAGHERPGAGHAAPGETVWVLVNHIKPGKLEAHHRWVYDILMPAVQRVAPDLLRSVRFLEAHEEDNQEPDGTQRSVFIMDPVLADETAYRFDVLLRQAYSAEQAQAYLDQIEEWVARLQTSYILKQSAW
jgi:hypothetical protein